MFDFTKYFEYENGFYLTSDISRIGKLLAHYEIYKKILDLPGEIVECGVFKGASLIRFATFRDLLESPFSRKVIGFDVFGEFPETHYVPDKHFVKSFIESAGKTGISIEKLKEVFEHKKTINYELVKGDINQTIPEYANKNPQLKIALLHIDTDVYEPAVTILENLFDRVVRGGIIAFDDYGTFPGETKAVDDFFTDKKNIIRKLSISHIPSYIVKE
ncbi:MAG TPA: TylF/MycF/NovP-related O-methyltransferase [Candidatus Wunengus sp. YC60]|uniref:TylF/MycF/NovP-related O-methyltransferase n=1 Tax=Candidatus Wunengus sp. YC60 TaxID=3367697 RepID=UPI004025E997